MALEITPRSIGGAWQPACALKGKNYLGNVVFVAKFCGSILKSGSPGELVLVGVLPRYLQGPSKELSTHFGILVAYTI